MAKYPWKHVWITGASSGIGKELAVTLSNAGVHVSASARSHDDLEALQALHTSITAYPIDVTEAEQVESLISRMEQQHGAIDLAVLGAGVWSISDIDNLELKDFRKAIEVNYLGVVGGLLTLLATMRRRGGGQIAVLSSVAGYRGLPRSAYYGPTKAALINLCESLQPELERQGVKLQIINPGFVRTPMTEMNEFPMPFMIETDVAVRHILMGLKGNAFEIAFPWQLVTILKIMRVLPYRLYLWLIRSFVLPK